MADRIIVGGKPVDLERDAIIKRLRTVKPDPLRTHAVEVGGRLYPVKQAFAAVTGADVLDFNTLQARSAFRRLGFKVTEMALTQRERTPAPTGNGNGAIVSDPFAFPDAHFRTVLADPPWRFINRTGKVAPEHRRLSRYDTLTTEQICALSVPRITTAQSHLYLWVPNALVADGLRVMSSWGFTYKSNLVWHKIRKDGGSDGRGVGFYFRNVTELVLFGVRGSLRTLDPGRRQVNLLATRKREHSRKPDELYNIIEACSPGPFLELFARYPRSDWTVWGDEAKDEGTPRGRQFRGYGGTIKPRVLPEVPPARPRGSQSDRRMQATAAHPERVGSTTR